MSRRVILTPPTINGLTMPEWFYDRWSAVYEWIPPKSIVEGKTNGYGELYIAGYWRIEWTWEKMHQSWWRWWTVDVLGGALQLACNVTVWSPNGVTDDELTTYSATVYHPAAFGGRIKMTSGQYEDITIRIGRIPLATLPNTNYWTVSLSAVGGSHVISS